MDDKGEWIDRSNLPEAEQDKAREERNKLEAEWNRAVTKQIALGKLDPKVAEAAGWRSDIRESGLIDLPEMWHVTTAADLVRKEGLKTRAELGQSYGKGLGGGPDDTLSFTTDRKIAEDIHGGMLEFHDLLNNKISMQDLAERARSGSDAKRPYLKDVMESMKDVHGVKNVDALLSGKTTHRQWNIGGEHPPREKRFNYSKGEWEQIPESEWRRVGDVDGSKAFTDWERNLTEDEQDHRKAQFYKTYSLYRQEAGGPEDPLFFSTDVDGFKNIPRDQIQVLKFSPADKDEQGGKITPKGYRVSSLGEIRTWTGSAVKHTPETDAETEAWLTKGSLGIPREEMPQLPGGAQEEFANRLEERGIKVERGSMRVSALLPTQSSMNMEKVNSMEKTLPMEKLTKPILVSSDNHILDGHHRWAALRLKDPTAKIQTIKVDLPIKTLWALALDEPGSTRRTTKDAKDD